MGPYVEIDDTGSTYQTGQHTSGLAGDARAAGESTRTLFDGITPGSSHGAPQVLAAAGRLGDAVFSSGQTMANGAENLGAGTSNIGITMQQSENESVFILNQNTFLNRQVNQANTPDLTN